MVGIFFKQYRYYIVILTGVLAGALLANLVIDDITDKIGIFNYDFKNAVINVSLDRMLYLRYILKLRIKEYVGFILILFTPAALLGAYMFMAFIGISTGMMVSVCVMNMGIKGMLIYAVCLVPQYIIYAVAVSLIVSSVEVGHMEIKKTAVNIIISLLFMIIGILYETYVSTWLMKALLEHISYCI